MAEKTESSGANNRWWESYLVRYFLGFIVGAICVAIIAKYADLVPGAVLVVDGAQKAVEHESKYGVTSIVITVALLGLAYCYVASTPITVLHAGRYIKGPADGISRLFWFGWVFVLLFLMLTPSLATTQFYAAYAIYSILLVASISLIVIFAVKKFNNENKKSTDPADVSPNNPTSSSVSIFSKTDYFLIFLFFSAIWSFSQFVPRFFDVAPQISDARLLAIGTPVIWIGIVQYFVLFNIIKNPADNYKFYKNLFAARQQTGAKDVRDTYSHLREHSNAIFIVAVEISMLALMLGGIKIERSANIVHASPLDGATFWLCALGIWMVPTIFMWSRANAMERYFSDNPSHFITEKTESSPTPPAVETKV
ncbi:hypothetical protein JAB9_21300 [Janthinobacterium sp. HH107]|uniref:hypothetical protein n=1 Tax=Janthinobacterium sp. HH107 TaxID=1537279 RepID=UPI000892D57C|nr:hypothetical protein [Janthinobacterium sp. HH107]OEZ99486.1 hypothetical protein JAB9_21300 [Janthinobacterium sp. HH107]